MFRKKKPEAAQAGVDKDDPGTAGQATAADADPIIESAQVDGMKSAGQNPSAKSKKPNAGQNRKQTSASDVVRHQGSAARSYLAGIFNPPDPAPGLAYAGLWRRYLAFLIDFPLSLVAAIAAEMLCQAILPKSLFFSGFTPIILMFVAQFAYFVLFEGSNWKATPGKRLLKLRVTDKRGQKITMLRATARLLIGLPFIFLFAGFLMIGLNRKRQSLADRVTGTLVVRKTTESFLPKAVRSFEFPTVIAMSILLTLVAIGTTARVAIPVADRMTLRVITEGSLKLMVPAQKAVETSVAKNKVLPAELDRSLIGYSTAGFPHTIAYNPSSGAITLWFMQRNMQGQGLSMIPTLEKGSDRVVWRCAAVNMDAQSTPALCAPSRR